MNILDLNVSEDCINDIIYRVESILEGMNLADVIDRKVEKELEKNPEADVRKYDKLRKRAEKIPSMNDLHKENGKWNSSNINKEKESKNFKGGLKTDERRNLTDEQKDALLHKRVNDIRNNYPEAIQKSKERYMKKNGLEYLRK